MMIIAVEDALHPHTPSQLQNPTPPQTTNSTNNSNSEGPGVDKVLDLEDGKGDVDSPEPNEDAEGDPGRARGTTQLTPVHLS